MKQASSILLRCLGLSRQPPKTPLGRYFRHAERILTVLAVLYAGLHVFRSFSSVAAHEITHGLIRHRLGLLRGIRLPSWVAEGYCDFVARESSFPEAEGLRLFASGQSHPSMSYRYFTYRQMVRYLVEDEHLTFSEVVARANDSAAVAAEARKALQSGTPQ